jgi:hypothetical protein
MKRPKISKHEIIADLVFILIGMLAAFIAIFIFDIHWSFYPGNTIFPPNKHIFTTPTPYLVGVPLGGLAGLVVIKLLYYAFAQQDEAIEETKWNGYGKRKR